MDLTQLIFMRLTELIQTETTDLNKFQLPQEVRSNKDGNHQETPTTGPRMLKLDSKDGPTRSTHGLKSLTSEAEMICKNQSPLTPLSVNTLTDLTQLTFTRLTEPTPTETTDPNKSQLPQEAKNNRDGNLQETLTTGLKMPKPDNKAGPMKSTHGLKSSTSDLETICKNLSQPTLPCIKTNSTENNWISLVESENLILFKI